MKTWKTSLTMVLLALTAWAAEPANVIKETTGEAAIGQGGESAAFEEAKKMALRQAVEEAAGVLLQSDTLVLNSQMVSDRVFTNATGYVKKFDILDRKVDKRVVKVKVKSEIGVAALDKDLQAVKGIIARLGRTKLIVVVQEQSVDAKGIAQRGEILSSKLTEAFKRDGWKLIDEKGTVADGAMKVSAGVGSGALDPKEIGKKTDADYILYGSINLRYMPPSETNLLFAEVDPNTKKQLMFFTMGDYDLAMFETRTGTQLAKIAGKMNLNLKQSIADMAKVSKSYEVTANMLANEEAPRIVSELRNPVIEFLRNRDVNGNEIAVHVLGLSDFTAVDEFHKAVSAMKDVKLVKNGDYKAGKAEYEVSFLGNATDLGRALATATFKKKKVTVTGVQNNLIEVSIAK